MAQNREKEETELKVPETLVCSTSIPTPPKLSGTEDPASAAARLQESLDPPASGTDRPRSRSARLPKKSDLAAPTPRPADAEVKRREVNRCSGCRKKVGLMGFRCRCGELFCSDHRYSDRHDCSFDYKAAGREAIARENPLVRAAKILKV